MDTHMMDVDGDIVLDVEPGMEVQEFQQPHDTPVMGAGELTARLPNGHNDEEMPAAYYENLEEYRPIKPVPETLNLQGVSDFGPNEPMDYALEHCPERKPKRVRWINDNSVNLEYYNAHDAADALLVLTHPDAGIAASIPAQTPRKAVAYSNKPDSALIVREANTGDHKERNAADRSDYYRRNPQARELKQQRRREDREPSPVFLDYGDEGTGDKARSGSFDDAMSDGERPADRHQGRRSPYQRNDRSDRSGRKDVDSYRPGSHSRRESKFGRLRNRSASPASDEDGRFGFAEDDVPRRYRSRSREQRRRRSRSRSGDRQLRKRPDLETSRWEKDRYDPHQRDSGRWIQEGPVSPMSHHRRSDATDETHHKGSLLSRMTKDGRPVAAAPGRSLADRITRDGDDSDSPNPPKRDLLSRITRADEDAPSTSRHRNFRNDDSYGRLRDDNHGRLNSHSDYQPRPRRVQRDENYGRLKDDDSAPRETDFQDPTSGGGGNDLLNRITWVRDGGGDNRRASNQKAEKGFSIRGSATTQPSAGGFSIRGAASGE